VRISLKKNAKKAVMAVVMAEPAAMMKNTERGANRTTKNFGNQINNHNKK